MRERTLAPCDLPEPESVNAKPWDRSRPPGRILAIRLQAFGDTVVTLPYLQALHRLVPRTPIDFLTRSEVAELPSQLVLFDRVFEIGGGRNPRRQLLSALTLVPRLWALRYDLVVDLQRNRVSRVVRRLLGPRAWSEFDRFSPRQAGERTRHTIEAIGLGALRVQPDLKLHRPEAGLAALHDAGWHGETDLVVLNPAAAFAGRNWPLPHYVEFCRVWTDRRARPVRFLLLGLPKMAPSAAALQKDLGEAVINLVGRVTASLAFAILQHATLVLSEDSGLLHLAWAAGAPTVGLFGASRRAWAQPTGNYSAVISTCREPDGTCLNGMCRAGAPHCLAQLEASPVVDLALRLLDDVGRRAKIISPGEIGPSSESRSNSASVNGSRGSSLDRSVD